MTRPGVSVVICTHNGATKIAPAIEHLRRQRTQPNLKWELLLIDNASTDSTAQRVRQLWSAGPAKLRVVSEPLLGEWHARVRGLQEAQGEIIGFVDDDNWVAPDWMQRLAEIMSADSAIGACGSMLAPVFDVTPPSWFERYQIYYGIQTGAQATRPPVSLCAAGMGLRASAWHSLVAQGFRGHLTGRVGPQLSSGCDTELCYALKLAGWKLVLDSRLKVQHYLPPERLTWNYLRTLLRSSSYSVAALDGYYYAWQKSDRLRESWAWAFASGTKHLLLHHSPLKILASRMRRSEGDDEAILIDIQLARLRGLLSLRGRYSEIRREIRKAAWRTTDRLL